jgi:capsular polysaccharide biosynthesis protein
MFSAQLQGQLSVSRSRRDALLQQIEDSKVEIEELRKRIEKTPETERGLAGLMREQKNVNAEYQELQDKKAKAQLAENLEENQKAEKFSILEAAERPEKPSSPERVKLSVLSLFFALGAGAAAAAGAEFLTATIRGRAHLNKVIGADPIAVIPNFERERDKAEGPRFGFGRKPRTSPPAEQASTSPGDSQLAKTDELVS